MEDNRLTVGVVVKELVGQHQAHGCHTKLGAFLALDRGVHSLEAEHVKADKREAKVSTHEAFSCRAGAARDTYSARRMTEVESCVVLSNSLANETNLACGLSLVMDEIRPAWWTPSPAEVAKVRV